MPEQLYFDPELYKNVNINTNLLILKYFQINAIECKVCKGLYAKYCALKHHIQQEHRYVWYIQNIILQFLSQFEDINENFCKNMNQHLKKCLCKYPKIHKSGHNKENKNVSF